MKANLNLGCGKWKRVRRLTGLLIGLAIAAFGLAVPSPIAAYDAPDLRAGDAWTYRTNTSLATGFFLHGSVTLTVSAREDRTVEGVRLDVYRMSLNGLGTAVGTVTTDFGSTPARGSWVLTGEQLVETRGLRSVSSVLDLEANGTLETNPVPLTFQLSVQNTTTLEVLEESWAFPVEVGHSGSMTARLNFTEDFRLYYGLPASPTRSQGLGWQNVSYEAESIVNVDTPAGRFETLRIRRSQEDGTYTLSFFAPVAGNDVKSETYDESGPIGSAELISYRYQASEPPRLLGLTASDWALVAAVGAVTAGVTFVWKWRGRRGRVQPGSPPT